MLYLQVTQTKSSIDFDQTVSVYRVKGLTIETRTELIPIVQGINFPNYTESIMVLTNFSGPICES